MFEGNDLNILGILVLNQIDSVALLPLLSYASTVSPTTFRRFCLFVKNMCGHWSFISSSVQL